MFASMIYNSIDDIVILWGGRLWEPLEDNSIWEYEITSNKWIEFPNDEGPKVAYAYPSMVHITAENKILLFGGGLLESTFVGNPINDTWEFDCKSRKWVALITKNSPPPVTIHSMVYVPKDNKLILFGGETESMYSNRILEGTWILSIKDSKWDKK